MNLSWGEIRANAIVFSNNWEKAKSERAECQTFWNEFFEIFGVTRRRVATFEAPVKKLNGKYGFIDLFWKGELLVEHKSKGQNLDKAYYQAIEYFANLKEYELPKYVLVSDFQRFRLYNLDDDEQYEFLLSSLEENIQHLGFISGYNKTKIIDDIPVNIEAANRLIRVYEELSKVGLEKHDLNILLVRLLYCFFADDSGLFQKKLFAEYIANYTKDSGNDLGEKLSSLFQVLDKEPQKRLNNIDPLLGEFPYVNGSLFKEKLDTVYFDKEMRDVLVECSHFNWSKVSPAIFGSMFQSAMDPEKRRELGAHYTSEKNVLKVISPLFIDALREELENIKLRKTNKSQCLELFIEKISSLIILDPACGCGSFLIVTYRELRTLEMDVLIELEKASGLTTDIKPKVSIEQFYGIEREELPAQITQTALWLTEHQMNQLLAKKVGIFKDSLPLSKLENILVSDALNIDWKTVADGKCADFVIGNPPYKGVLQQSPSERLQLKNLYKEATGSGKLDYVAGWFLKAAQYIQNTKTEVGFVSTSSISNGIQVETLWKKLLSDYNVNINFAHRPFKWGNEIKKKAARHVVIVGFSCFERKVKKLFDFDDFENEVESVVSNINPYLISAENILVAERSKPLCNVPEIRKGNQATDGGHLLLSDIEKGELIARDPSISPFIKRVMGSDEMVKGKVRWCLWLVGASPAQLRSFKVIETRLNAVRKKRLGSTDPATVKRADTPYLFREQNNPNNYLAIPTVTKEQRKYLTLKFLDGETIPTNNLFIFPNATLWHFGVLSSYMNRLWTENICGRHDKRNRYSKGIGYNAFPWPLNPNERDIEQVESATEKVLKARLLYPDSSLADLYYPGLMPKELIDAHSALDKAVERSYLSSKFKSDSERLETLMSLYKYYINLEMN
jgi:hypothetical protein